MIDTELKYLFTILYKDGSTRRAYHYDDVIKRKDIKQFTLEDDKHKFLVNLVDGHFEFDDVSFRLHDVELTDFRLIFFRRNRYSGEDCYRFGWQANDKDGKNHQRVIEIN